ncbi:MAG: hypothetical protein HXX08_10890 [Chloroflexi bacterium]|uniref:Hydrogenase n=1 Tax=Candidatus Chlorohelix allophototropha TaxID=3003348 RepID=A0A8T7LZ71_9CHLR|nr:hypothetical protein [Chloroflexota bacterium]WJW65744.1 hypothetical protein OZ401_001522 [Chloroflexota bacterium L227-S17]
MSSERILDFSTLVLLFSTGLLVINRRLNLAIMLVAFQSLILAFISFLVEQASGLVELYFVVALTLVVKVIGATIILKFVLRRVKNQTERGIIGRGLSTAIVVGLIMVSYNAVRPLKLPIAIYSPNSLPVALSMLLIGLFIMISRKKALMEVIGIITIENGLFLVALSTTYGMPLFIEFGIFFDVMVGVIMMGFFAFQINAIFDTLNIDELSKLKG